LPSSILEFVLEIVYSTPTTPYFLHIALTMPRAVQTILVFSLLIFLVACDLPINQEEAEAINNQSEDIATPNSVNAMSHLLLGTGSVQGVYFPIGGVICRLLNRHKHLHKIRCSLESTGGSIYNLKEISLNRSRK